MRHFRDAPPGLTPRARRFVNIHGIWLDVPSVQDWRQRWEEDSIPLEVIERAAAHQTRWGGLALPPSPGNDDGDGGPRVLCVGTPEREDDFAEHGWWFEAGPQRTALPYSYLIGPDGSFGLAGDTWVPLHATIEGWIESLALAYAARSTADTVTKVSGNAVADLDLAGMQLVPETAGLANTWWLRAGSLVAIYNGEAELFSRPAYRTAYVYSGNFDAQWL
ncbi:hypothetical protein AB0C29_42750 [Actinoplanes sp. NPDC048791]|uniref:hypothetical protein n=1 Tax=Actinoplanes sp. NPDC048791 TaxID=3154623 RepID=UPI0033F774FD